MDNIKDRIKKLLAMAQDERGNENENEVAMRMANKLMMKHGIDAADIELQTGKQTVYSWGSVVMPVSEHGEFLKNHPLWVGFVATGIGIFADCKVSYVNHVVHGVCIRFQGEVMDVEFATYLFKMMRDYGYSESKKLSGSDRGTFKKVYAIRLCNRMKALVEERKEEMATASAGTALVVVDRKIALRNEAFGAQTYKKPVAIRVSSSEGYERGREAADRVNFSRPLGQSAANSTLK